MNSLIGKRVRCIHMNDPYPVPSGTEGTVVFIDGLGSIDVDWDNGSTLSLIPGQDTYEVIG